MTKLLWLVVLGVVTGLGSSYMTWHVLGQVAAAQGTFPSLSYEYMERQLDEDGKVVYETRETRAMRSDGSAVRVMSKREVDGTPTEIRDIVDLSKMARISVNSALEAVTTVPIDQRVADYVRAQHRSCDRAASAIRSTMLGYEVVRHAETLTFSQGDPSIEVEAWLAPALGCIRLEETHDRASPLANGVKTVLRQVSDIRLGEPDVALFSVPGRYTEMSFAEVFRQLDERFGSEVDPTIASILERNYQLSRENGTGR